MTLVERRFWVLARRPAEGCWEWGGYLFKGKQYGGFNYNGKTRKAHRVAFELANGRPIKEGYLIMHTCDNPRCVNPAHLVEGTSADNTRDMIAKGRDRGCARAGGLNIKAKLTAEQVLEIRALYVGGWLTRAELGALYGISRQTIHNIVHMETW